MVSSEVSRPEEGRTAGIGVIPDGDAQLAAAVLPAYATWPQRVVAAILDNAILGGVTWLAFGAGFAQPSLTPGYLAGGYGAAGDEGWPGGPMILVPIGAVVTLVVLQALTGWTPGKLVVGIRVVRERSAGPAGLPTTLARWVLHLLDAILLIGYLRPVWHKKRQTFADTIVHTVVVQELPDLPRRQRIAVYGASLVAVVLGLGYCLPINSASASGSNGYITCGQEDVGPYVTTGDIRIDGSVSVNRERRLWTVRETRTAHPGATLSWASDPSVRDVRYRVELDARPTSEDGPVVSRSWDIGTGGTGTWSDDGLHAHTRTVSPDGDVHVAEVELRGADSDTGVLGTDVWTDVRLIADGEVVAACGGTTTYDEIDQSS